MKKDELKKVVEVLEKEEVSREFLYMLENILQNQASDEVELINRPDYVATVLWCEEDFIGALEDHDMEANEENLLCLIDKVQPNLEDVSLDWEVIEDAAAEMRENNKALNKSSVEEWLLKRGV